MGQKTEQIMKVGQKLDLMRKADRDEKPICPICKEGHIISLCNSRIYKCDNKNCDYWISVYLAQQ